MGFVVTLESHYFCTIGNIAASVFRPQHSWRYDLWIWSQHVRHRLPTSHQLGVRSKTLCGDWVIEISSDDTLATLRISFTPATSTTQLFSSFVQDEIAILPERLLYLVLEQNLNIMPTRASDWSRALVLHGRLPRAATSGAQSLRPSEYLPAVTPEFL